MIVANDIAGLGKVATAAALPLLAACQIETALLPTVLLSSHTGGFPDVYVEDYTQGLQAFLQQWRSLEQDFSALLTGYLAGPEQLSSILDFAKEKNLPLLADPVMGDKGRLYHGFDQQYVKAMRQLVSQAHLVLPNLTEAALLLDRPYSGELLPEAVLEEICRELAGLGAKQVLLTGVQTAEDQIGFAYYDSETGSFCIFQGSRLPQHFYGTGDMVTALAAAAFIQKVPLEQMLPLILDFVSRSLLSTVERGADLRLGVFYQPHLAQLWTDFQRLAAVDSRCQPRLKHPRPSLGHAAG
nr:pyridoxamine kinase [Streptococcus panodentis]